MQRLEVEAARSAKVGSATGTAGAVAGVGVAALGPSAAIAVATTFGTASTGTAISALSGAAATNAALAWLGGGALAAGGGGVAAGNALLALAGPVGWTVAGVSLVGAATYLRSRNAKHAKEAAQRHIEVEAEIRSLRAAEAEIAHIAMSIRRHADGCLADLDWLRDNAPGDYREFADPHKERLAALWTALDEHLRGKALASGLEARKRAFRDALNEVVAVRDFVSCPERILGSDRTKSGEVAEHVHVAIRRAKDVMHQRRPTATFDGVPRTGRVDYVDDGTNVQSKYYRGLSESLGGVSFHAGKYEDFATGGGRYHIPKDQYEQLREFQETGSIEGLSARTVQRIERQMESIRQETGRPIEEILGPGEASYDEVQLDRVHETIDDREKGLARENERLKSEVRDEHRASLARAGKAAAVGALAGGGLGLAATLWSKYLEGENPFRGELTAEDWKEAGVSALKGAAAGAVSGFSVYVLTGSTRLGAPFAGSLVSALMGVGTLLGQREAGEIDDAEFVDLALLVAAESALTCIAAVAGQTLVPVLLLGAFVGSVAGKLVESALRGGLAEDAEAELLERLQAYVREAIDALDAEVQAILAQYASRFEVDLNALPDVPAELSDVPWSTRVLVYRDAYMLASTDGSVSPAEETHPADLANRMALPLGVIESVRAWVRDYGNLLERLDDLLSGWGANVVPRGDGGI